MSARATKFADLPSEAIEQITSFLPAADLCNAAIASQALAAVTAEQRLEAKADQFRRKKLLQKAFRFVRFAIGESLEAKRLEAEAHAYVLDDEVLLFNYFFGLV